MCSRISESKLEAHVNNKLSISNNHTRCCTTCLGHRVPHHAKHVVLHKMQPINQLTTIGTTISPFDKFLLKQLITATRRKSSTHYRVEHDNSNTHTIPCNKNH